MTKWEAIKAMVENGAKIRHKSWAKKFFAYYDAQKTSFCDQDQESVDETLLVYDILNPGDDWEVYTGQPKEPTYDFCEMVDKLEHFLSFGEWEAVMVGSNEKRSWVMSSDGLKERFSGKLTQARICAQHVGARYYIREIK